MDRHARHHPHRRCQQNVTECQHWKKILCLRWPSPPARQSRTRPTRAGSTGRTIYRKLDDPAFRSLVAEYRDRLIATALGRIADAMTRGADVLAEMLESPKDHIRIRAARALISLGLRLRESVDLTARMREVELELARRQEDRS